MNIDTISLTCPPNSDFWVIPDENRHSGLFQVKETLAATTDFEVSVQLQGSWSKQYDQGGIMLRISDTKWVKSGIEYYAHDGAALAEHVSAVVTDPYSDWSITKGTKTTVLVSDDWLVIKLSKRQSELIVQWSYNDDELNMIRQVPAFFLGNNNDIELGLTVASPKNENGCKVTFRKWTIKTS